MRVSTSGFWADEAQCPAARSPSATWDGELGVWLRRPWWGCPCAARGRETDPRRLVSEVGPSETGLCVSGAGGPGLQQNPPRPRGQWQLKTG